MAPVNKDKRVEALIYIAKTTYPHSEGSSDILGEAYHTRAAFVKLVSSLSDTGKMYSDWSCGCHAGTGAHG